jgi:PAS domain S-box-containing protein
MRADVTAAPLLLVFAVTTIGLLCLTVALWRALRRARITEREATLRSENWAQEEERFRTPLERAEDYTIFLLDSTGRPTSWNSSVRRVLGYERAEFLRLSAADLYTREDREARAPERDLAEAAAGGRASADRWVVRKDHSRLWASVATSGVQDRQGRLLGFSQRLRDLSRSKGIELQLHRKQGALELALEAAGLGTWEYDLTTGEMSWDARAKALFGLPVDTNVTHPEPNGTRPCATGRASPRSIASSGPTGGSTRSCRSASARWIPQRTSRTTWRASCWISPSAAGPRSTCRRLSAWRPWAGSPAGSPTT